MKHLKLNVDYLNIAMEAWHPAKSPGYGWPLGERAWINPSPNASNISMARCYPGTVMVEGTTLSEGRGTTRPLELFGAPDLDADKLLASMSGILETQFYVSHPRSSGSLGVIWSSLTGN